SPEEASRLETGGRRVAVITQTTLSLDDVAPIVGALADQVGSTLKRPAADDICYATQNRQDAVKRLAEEATLILVIGSPSSSNAQRLVEVASNAGAGAAVGRGEEREAGFFCDVEEMLKRLVPLETLERERMLLALLGPRTEAVPFVDGRLCLGTWQKILIIGFNGTPADWTCTILG